MAEFQEIVREFHRLCETQRKLHKNTCDKCPIKIATLGTVFQCYRYVLEKPKDVENIIMSWATENPEPIYPRWCDWLVEQGVLVVDNSFPNMRYWYTMDIEKMEQPIPANIAKKLGIEPKES